jgi:hypothetical protein
MKQGGICNVCGVACGVHYGVLESANESKREAFKEIARLKASNLKLLHALRLANDLIGIEPYEHVSEEATKDHYFIHEVIDKAELDE